MPCAYYEKVRNKKMEKQFMTTSESPQVVLEIHANLRLKGWDELQVAAKTDSENNLSIEQVDDTIRVVCNSDCKVSVPRLAMVTVETVSGDATIKGLEGELILQEAQGNLVIHGAGQTVIHAVHGDLSVKNVAGDLKITSVDGNVSARDVQGDFTVSEIVHGNLTLKDVSGNASAKADGNVTLSLDPAPDEQYDFTAKGDLLCNLPADASAAVHIAHGGDVTVKISGVELAEVGDEPIDFTLGDGDAVLKLSADGNVFVGSQTPGWEEMGNFGVKFGEKFENMGKDFENIGKISEQITQQIESQIGALEMQLEAQLSGLNARLGAIGLSSEQQERVAERARDASERASERVQEKMRRAQEKLDRKVAEAQRRAEQRAHEAERRARVHEHHTDHREHRGWRFDWPSPSTPPATAVAPSDPVSDDERMVILRMLEQKKITPEQAEQLLSALEGKGA
jgi:hypothetical protein